MAIWRNLHPAGAEGARHIETLRQKDRSVGRIYSAKSVP